MTRQGGAVLARWRHVACGVALAAGTAQAAPVHELAPVRIDGMRLERSLADAPAAVAVVDTEAAQQGQPRLQLDETLSRVPGLMLTNRYNYAQNLRLSSRGFGARAPFGVRGLRVRVDGFPETVPDGQSQVDSIDLDSLRDATVLRGPASVLYGNGSGGVVDLNTYDGRNMAYGRELRVTVGEHGLRKAHLHAGGEEGDWSYYGGVTGLRYEGYRDQSEVEKYQAIGRVGWQMTPAQRLELVLTAMDIPRGEDPGGLTAAQVNADRRAAVPMAPRLDAGQEVSQQRLGVRYRHDDVAGGQYQVQTFIARRDFEQQLPFPGNSHIEYQRLFYGLSTDYSRELMVAGRAQRFVVGLDADAQRDDRDRHSVNASGQTTGRTAEEKQTASAVGVFAQLDSALTDQLLLSLGLRHDTVRLRINDRFLSDGDDSGTQRFHEQSYSAGLTWHYSDALQLYMTGSTAFETPTFTELANPVGGGFDSQLGPQKARNQELGLRSLIGAGWWSTLALYRVDVKDEITPYELQGRTFYRNAARTRRQGLELGIEGPLSEQWSLALAYTWAHNQFRRFDDVQQGADVSGLRMPGLPRHIAFAELAWRGGLGYYAISDLRFVSDQYAENTNQTRVASSTLVGLRGGRQWRFGDGELDLYSGINNLFDREYFANLRINANSDRPLAQRGYFEPGPGRTVYAGVAWKW